jgi:hypothetical protein
MGNELIFPADKKLEVINEFPADKFNVLIPTKIIQEASSAHRIMIRLIQINVDLDHGGEIYESKDHANEYEFNRKAIDKFMAGAAIEIYETKAVTPTSCINCVTIAKETITFPDCIGKKCDHRADVAWEVTITVPEGVGKGRLVTARKELQMATEKANMSEARFNRFFPHRASHCETKALSRAVRKALSLKISYTMEELQKPFVVALLVPNMEDPAVKNAAIAAYFGTSKTLFNMPTAAPVPQLMTPAGQVLQITAKETLEPEQEEPPKSADEPKKETKQTDQKGQHRCQDPGCGKFITEGVAKYSLDVYGIELCQTCQHKPGREKIKG